MFRIFLHRERFVALQQFLPSPFRFVLEIVKGKLRKDASLWSTVAQTSTAAVRLISIRCSVAKPAATMIPLCLAAYCKRCLYQRPLLFGGTERL
jgi:hypothetical protein